jgi:hypothetical protein
MKNCGSLEVFSVNVPFAPSGTVECEAPGR